MEKGGFTSLYPSQMITRIIRLARFVNVNECTPSYPLLTAIVLHYILKHYKLSFQHAGLMQRIDARVIDKITELVKEGVTNVAAIE